jgi:hypothetical protein
VYIIYTRWCDRFTHHVSTTKLFNGLIVEPPHRAAVVLYFAVTSQQNNKSSLINKTNRHDASLCSATLIAFPSILNPCSTKQQRCPSLSISGKVNIRVTCCEAIGVNDARYDQESWFIIDQNISTWYAPHVSTVLRLCNWMFNVMYCTSMSLGCER